MTSNLHIAKWWHKNNNNKIVCTLCPRYCELSEGQKGFCYVRENIDGVLYSTGYGKPTGFAVDPIEKKPLFHFYPGSKILSFGTAGCNLGCKFCQNWHTSKAKIDETYSVNATARDVIEIAKKYNSKSIAFTYNDPTIFGEFVIDVSKLARKEGIKTVMVTAGYICKEARKEIYEYIDAANVDLKAFTDEFYHKYTYSHLSDILDTLLWLKNETSVWIELTTLLIKGLNDSNEEIAKMCDWVIENLGNSVPHHFTAFHPAFKMTYIEKTSPEILFSARNLALKKGIKYVYCGNISDEESSITYCPGCGKSLIRRGWHSVYTNNIIEGKCKYCNIKIEGEF
jgi:pyruvate formate lyase activating enzyme